MKQACSLESMVDAVLSEMKRRGNAKNTIERHQRAYSQFCEYALSQSESCYSESLARSFWEEKEKLSVCRGPRFMEQYRIALNKLDDIAKNQDIRLRHLRNGYQLKTPPARSHGGFPVWLYYITTSGKEKFASKDLNFSKRTNRAFSVAFNARSVLILQ